MKIALRDVQDSDLDIFFENERDEKARHMAAFTSKEANKESFLAHWTKIRANDAIIIRTILVDETVVGSVLSFMMDDQREISYWIGRSFWGKGITTEALRQYLRLIEKRPLFARVAKDNIGSKRVLEKCGFTVIGEDKGFAFARDATVEEFILRLD